MEVSARPLTSMAVTSVVLGGGLMILALILWLSAEGAIAVWGIGAVVLLGLGVAAFRPDPLAQLTSVLLLLLFQLRGEEGTTFLEVISGLALASYLLYWYADVLLRERRVVTSTFDAAALTWGFVGLCGGAALGALFGADPYDFRADILATIPFFLYLPVKEACARLRNGPLLLTGVLIVYGLVASGLGVLYLREVVTGATQWWQIADARFGSSETSLTIGLLLCFAGSAISPRLRIRLALLALAGLILAGMILSRSRGYWVASMVGLIAVAVWGGTHVRRNLAVSVGLGVVALVGVTLLFFSEEATLLVVGTVNRFASLSTAGQDISLLNRFAESAGAREMIFANPILGYGWGVQSTHYSLIAQGTMHWAFLHNGYLALWMKTGLWGLGLMGYVWAGAILRGAKVAQSPLLSATDRIAVLGASGTLTAFTLTAYTSNPFSMLDTMLIVTLALAVAHGVADRDACRREVVTTALPIAAGRAR